MRDADARGAGHVHLLRSDVQQRVVTTAFVVVLAKRINAEGVALPGLHSYVGVVTRVDTADCKPFAAPRLHHQTRTPPYADLPAISRCTPPRRDRICTFAFSG